MITKFKLYESMNIGEPKVGDWVICDEGYNWQVLGKTLFLDNPLLKFIRENIGYFYEYDYDNDALHPYHICYYNVPDYLYDDFNKTIVNGKEVMYRIFRLTEIIYWSEDKEDLEYILDAKKYNII